MKKTTETQLVKVCMDWLVLNPNVAFAWRSNTGAVTARYQGRRRFVRFGFPGCPDILGFLKGGRFFAAECKLPGRKQTDEQRTFQVLMERNGGLYVLAHSLDDLRMALEERLLMTARSGR